MAYHSSDIVRGLRSTKFSTEFYVNIVQGIHKGKIKLCMWLFLYSEKFIIKKNYILKIQLSLDIMIQN